MWTLKDDGDFTQFCLNHEDYIMNTPIRFPRLFTVRSGDTLSHISERELGKASRWKEIAKLNPHIPVPDHIYPGDVLVLPPV